MKKRYILSVAGIALAAVFFMQTTTPPEYPAYAIRAYIERALDAEANLPPVDKAAASQAGGQTSQGVANLPEPGKNASNMTPAEAVGPGAAAPAFSAAVEPAPAPAAGEVKNVPVEDLVDTSVNLPPDEKAAASQAGGQTSQGVADLPEPGNNKGGSSVAGASTEGDSGAAMQKFYNDILDAEDKEAGNPAGGQTSQGVADLPEPGKTESNMSTAEAELEEQDQNSKELENPAENEIDIGADFEKSDNQGNENPQQQSLE